MQAGYIEVLDQYSFLELVVIEHICFQFGLVLPHVRYDYSVQAGFFQHPVQFDNGSAGVNFRPFDSRTF